MNSQFSEVALRAIAAGLGVAHKVLMSPADSIDSEAWIGRQTPSRAVEDELLTELLQGAGHAGNSPDEPVDKQAHDAIQESIRKILPHSLVFGQKATSDEWRIADQADEGVLFNVDSIDGVLPFMALMFGYSTNILGFTRSQGFDNLEIAAVGLPGGRAALWNAGLAGLVDGRVRIGQWDASPWNSSVDTEEWGVVLPGPLTGLEGVKKNTVAALSSDPVHRRQLEPLLGSDSWTVFTTGGAPASFGLIAGALEALVATEWQATYDVAYLPMFLALRIPVISLENGQPLDAVGASRVFEGPKRSTKDDRPVPPFVAARTMDTAKQIAASLMGKA